MHTLSLKKFGPKIFLSIFSLNWTMLRKKLLGHFIDNFFTPPPRANSYSLKPISQNHISRNRISRNRISWNPIIWYRISRKLSEIYDIPWFTDAPHTHTHTRTHARTHTRTHTPTHTHTVAFRKYMTSRGSWKLCDGMCDHWPTYLLTYQLLAGGRCLRCLHI